MPNVHEHKILVNLLEQNTSMLEVQPAKDTRYEEIHRNGVAGISAIVDKLEFK